MLTTLTDRGRLFPDQAIPLIMTGVVFVGVWWLYYLEIAFLNKLLPRQGIVSLDLRWTDVLLGLTIYLKTSIDFAIFIGRLMSTHPGWKNRIMIEIGTAVGNALGTMVILLIWNVFREVEWLMAIMILVASLVLLRLAEDGMDHIKDSEGKYLFSLYGFVRWFEYGLEKINRAVAPVLNRLVPHFDTRRVTQGLWGLFALSFSIPFVLGLDDFAGYIPLFSVVNVYGFGVGVFLGHMILNIFLFISPRRTIRAVKHPVISFIGSLAFVGLAVWGFLEVWYLLQH